MGSMVEKAARAMIAKHYGPEGSDEFEEVLHNFGDSYRESAVAAIEAMREPTQRMRLAGVAEWSRPDPTPEHESTLVFNAIWRAMIDAALKENADAVPS
jgi:hypothetical protein